jgi:hypothetical protein
VACGSVAIQSSEVATTQHSNAMARSLWSVKSWLSWAAPPRGRRLRLWCRCSSSSGSSSWAQRNTPWRQLQLGDGRPVLCSACGAHTGHRIGGVQVLLAIVRGIWSRGGGGAGDGACVKGNLLLCICSLEKGHGFQYGSRAGRVVSKLL